MLIPTLAQVDSSALFKVGTRYADDKGNIYIYLEGFTGCVLGSVITYYLLDDDDAVTALLVTGATGQVAVAMGAVSANTKYGWFQIAGNNLEVVATSGGNAAAGATPYWQANGIIDDAVVADSQVFGATFSVQEGEVALGNGYAGLSMNYPFCTDMTSASLS